MLQTVLILMCRLALSPASPQSGSNRDEHVKSRETEGLEPGLEPEAEHALPICVQERGEKRAMEGGRERQL